MSSRTNWPNGVNYGHQNFTGRFARRASNSDTYGSYAPESERIPLLGWIGGAVFLMVVFGFVPFLNWLMT